MLNWGYAGVPCGDFRWWDGDQTLNKLRWCGRNGFRSTNVGLADMEDPQRRDEILAIREAFDLELHPHFGADWWNEEIDAIQAKGETFIAQLAKHKDDLHARVIGCTPGKTWRFHPERPIAWQLERLAQTLTPIAAGLAELGCPLAIENHGDYYCSDLVELCEAVPGLGIQLDTGNCFLIGEKPLAAAKEAAPYVLSTHLKDHVVFPAHKGPKERVPEGVNLALMIEGACLGEGDVQMAEILRVLLTAAERPEDLVLLWEMVPPKDMDANLAVERSWKVCRDIETEIMQGAVK